MEKTNLSEHQLTTLVLEKLNVLQQSLNVKDKPFLSMDEASEYLGISKNTLYGYTSKGIIPYYKPQNRKIFFKVEELNKFVLDKKNKFTSNQEIEEKAVTKIVTNKI